MDVILYEPQFKPLILDTLQINEAEKAELRASSGKSPEEALEDSLDKSHICWFGMDKGIVVAVGGVVLHPTEEGIGVPWLLNNEEFMMENLFTMNTMTYDLIDLCFNELDLYLIANHVSLHNTKSIKWLSAIGFEFMGAPKLLEDNETWFDQFYMYREDYQCVSQ